jgi:hypothetical protein
MISPRNNMKVMQLTLFYSRVTSIYLLCNAVYYCNAVETILCLFLLLQLWSG